MAERLIAQWRLVFLGSALIFISFVAPSLAQTQVGGSDVIVDYSVIDQLTPRPIYNPYATLPAPYGAYVYRQGYSYGGYGSPALVYPSVGGIANQPQSLPSPAYLPPAYNVYGDAVTLRKPKKGKQKLGEGDIFVPEVKPFVPGNVSAPKPSSVSVASSPPKPSIPAAEPAPSAPPAPSNDVPASVPSAASQAAQPARQAAPAQESQPQQPQPEQATTPQPQPEAATQPEAQVQQPEQQAQAEASKAPESQPQKNEAAPPQGQIRLTYDTEADELPKGSEKQLDDLVAKLQADENMRVQILAYASGTDDTESKARRRSLARGLNVRAYLIKAGIRSTRIEIRALGLKLPDSGPADRVDIVPAAG